MTKGNPASIRDFKRSGDLLHWIYRDRAMKLSLVIVLYSIVDSTINAFPYQCILLILLSMHDLESILCCFKTVLKLNVCK